MARREVADRGFIHLHVAAPEHVAANVFVNRLQPFCGQRDPFGHRLPRQPDLMARPVDRLLPVEWQVIAILTHDDLRQKSGSYNAAFQHRVGQCSDDRHCIEDAALHILRAHRAPAQEARRFIVEPFADFLANAPPVLRRGLHWLRHDDFLDDFQMLGKPGASFTRRRLTRRAPWHLRHHALRGFSRLVHALQEQQQLRGVEFLAFRAEEPPHQQVDLLPQQRVLLFQGSDSLQ